MIEENSWLAVVILIVGIIIFTVIMQLSPTMCDNLSFPVCTGG